MSQRNDVNLQEPQVRCQVRLEKEPLHGEPGIVHEHVNGDFLLAQRVENVLRCGGDGQVGRENLDFRFVILLEFPRQLAQQGLAAGNEHQLKPVGRQDACHFHADAAGSARDQRGL